MKKYANTVFSPVVFLMLFIFAAVIFLSLRQTAETRASARMVAHSQEVLFQTAKILSVITDNENISRGFLLTGKPALVEQLEKSKTNIYPQIDTLRRLTSDNAGQQTRIDSLVWYAKKKFNFSDSTIAVRNEKGSEAAIQMVLPNDGGKYMDQIKALLEEMQHQETRLLEERKLRTENANVLLDKIILSIIIVITALIIILLRKDYRSILARRTAEDSLKKSEASFQAMTNSVKDYAIFMLDKNGLVASWNKGAELVTGFDKHDIIGKPIDFFYNETDINDDEPRRNLAMAKKYGQFETESQRLRKGGMVYWANVVLIALISETGDLNGYSIIIRDITEKRKTQEELEFLSHQINHSNDAIFVVDADRKIKSWNHGAEDLYGYSKKEVLERDSNDLLKTNITAEELSTVLKKIARENYWTGELKRRTKSGETIYVHSSTTTIRDNRGNISGYVAVSFDITEQKKLREQVNHLARLVEQSTEAIISADLHACIISWNSGAEKLFGYSKKEAIGKTFTALGLDRPGPAGLPISIDKIIKEGSLKAEIDFVRKGGAVFFGAVNASTIKNEQEEINAVVFIVNDISLKKEMEQQLKRSNEELEQRVKERTEEIYKNEQRFRALIENSAEGISLLDEASDVIYRSPSAYRIIGNSPVKNSISYAHPEDSVLFKSKFSEALNKPHVPVPYAVRYYSEAGHYFWTEGTFTNLLDVKGVNAIVANYRDVTLRKESEEKLIASEKQFRHTLDNMLEGVQIIGFDWRYIYVNDSMARHGKYAKEELIGHTVMEKYPGIEHTEIYKIYQRCFSERLSFHLENEFTYPDGSVAWFELSFQPVPEGLFILSVDITDRKKTEAKLIKSEQLYRNLFEHILHGFCYCKADIENGRLKDFTYMGVNDEYEKLTGLKNVTGKKMSEINPVLLTEDNDYINTITKVLTGGKPEKLETYIKSLDKWFSISVYSPQYGYFISLVDNITKSKQHEQKINKLNTELEKRVNTRTEQLRKTNEELEAFSYSVSHDLRAPLRAIIGFTAILEEDYSSKLDEEAKRITSIIKSNTLKMGHLIDDLLMFSRMGRQDIVKTHIDNDRLVRDIINQPEIKQASGHRPIKWIVHDLPAINADIVTLRQVWINLISNAVKYSGKSESPQIEIGFYPEQDEIVFYVKDNGVGFDEKYKNKLFRVFQRLHTSDQFEGTGIGLAIVEKIISKHDGRVWADAAVNKGACFYFSLPASE